MIGAIQHSLFRVLAPSWYRYKLHKAKKSLQELLADPSAKSFQATEILPQKLYLGNLIDAINTEELKRRNIKYLVTAIHGMPRLLDEELNEEEHVHAANSQTDSHGTFLHQWWVRVPVLDRKEASIGMYFDAMNEWIHNRIGDTEQTHLSPRAAAYAIEHQKLTDSGIDSFPFVCTRPSHLHRPDFDSSVMVDTVTDTTATTVALTKDASRGAVLVHCIQGKSRSASLVIAYLMWSQRMTFVEALQFVKARRPLAEPNETFQEELQEFENILRSRGHYDGDEQVTISQDQQAAKNQESV